MDNLGEGKQYAWLDGSLEKEVLVSGGYVVLEYSLSPYFCSLGLEGC